MSESTKATIEILEHYHHNGGFYEIPVEVINIAVQELEELDNLLQQKENIIKEVREYIKEHTNYDNCESKNHLDLTDRDNILEILNKKSEV